MKEKNSLDYLSVFYYFVWFIAIGDICVSLADSIADASIRDEGLIWLFGLILIGFLLVRKSKIAAIIFLVWSIVMLADYIIIGHLSRAIICMFSLAVFSMFYTIRYHRLENDSKK